MDQGDGTFGRPTPALEDSLNALMRQNEERDIKRMLADQETRRQAVLTEGDVAALWPLVFRVGEELAIRKSRFRVECIGTDLLVLRLLPRSDAD